MIADESKFIVIPRWVALCVVIPTLLIILFAGVGVAILLVAHYNDPAIPNRELNAFRERMNFSDVRILQFERELQDFRGRVLELERQQNQDNR